MKKSPIRARRPGSVLLEHVNKVQLEGGGARFPMEVRSFAASSWRFPSNAAWLLDLDVSDWERPLLAGVRLYLNSDHQLIKASLENARSPASTVLHQSMFFDVGRQLVRGALSSPEFVAFEGRWPKETTGFVVSTLLRSRFKGERLDSLASALEQDPSGFDARLQDALRVWDGAE